MGDFNDAIDRFTKATLLDNTTASYWNNLGLAMHSVSPPRYAEALENFEEAKMLNLQQ